MTEPDVLLELRSLREAVEALAERTATPAALLTAEQAAELLNVPASWLLAEARADRVPVIRLGRYVRFDAAALREWCAGRRHGPRARANGSAAG